MTLARTDNPFLESLRPTAISSRFLIRVEATLVDRTLCKRKQVTDEMFLEAISWFNPPLLDEEMLVVVERELDPALNRTRRPRTVSISLTDIASHIQKLNREDIPAEFKRALVGRLLNRNKFTNLDQNWPVHLELENHKFGSMVSYLHREFQRLIGRGTTSIYFEPLGELTVPCPDLTPSQRAMELVREALDKRFRMDPPSRATLTNIKSKYSRQFS